MGAYGALDPNAGYWARRFAQLVKGRALRLRPSPRLSGERDVVVTELAAERGSGLGRVP